MSVLVQQKIDSHRVCAQLLWAFQVFIVDTPPVEDPSMIFFQVILAQGYGFLDVSRMRSGGTGEEHGFLFADF